MRTPVFRRPEKDIVIIRLATGEAVVRLYVSYIETPGQMSPGVVLLSANVVEIKVPDSPDLEMDVLHRWQFYYNKALENEIQYLREQYKKPVDGLLATLPPGKKAAVVDKVEAIIRSIASGDRPYLIRQDLLKILKQNI